MKANHFVVAGVLAFTLACPIPSIGADVLGAADISARDLTQSDYPMWKELASGIYAYSGLIDPSNKNSITTVSLVIVTEDGVIVVDGQRYVDQTQELIKNIAKLTPQPIKYVVVASDHPDHVGGNAAFKAAFPNVEFIASPVSQRALAGTDHPTVKVIGDKREISIGKTNIQILNLGRAHTGGDLVAYLPDSKILFMSEIYLRQVFPAMRSAYPSEWLETIRKAQVMDVSWYVPGHGFIDDQATLKAGLDESRGALVYVIEEARRLHAAGYACESPQNCPAADKAHWGPYSDWSLRSAQAPIAIAKVYEEIEGRLPD